MFACSSISPEGIERQTSMDPCSFLDDDLLLNNTTASTHEKVDSSGATLQSLLDQATDLLLAPTPELLQLPPPPPFSGYQLLLSLLEDDVTQDVENANENGVDLPPQFEACSESSERNNWFQGRKRFAALEKLEKRGGVSRGSLSCMRRKSGVGAWRSAANFSKRWSKASEYERKRREKINERLRNLGKLVPSYRKSDDMTPLLEKAVEHIKQLQAQSQMIVSNINNGTRTPNMMMPI